MSKTVEVKEIDHLVKEGALLIDVREESERLMGYIEGSKNIPLGELSKHLGELPKNQPVYISCQSGKRGETAVQLLLENGFDAYNVAGGYRAYAEYLQSTGNEKEEKIEGTQIKPDKELNCSGLQCPGPISQVFQAMNQMKDGEVLEVKVTDPGFIADAKAWCANTGNTFIGSETTGKTTVAYMRKGAAGKPEASVQAGEEKTNKGATLVVFNQDLDKAIASFIIATGAAAMGKKVTMFFTFWGLNILRRDEEIPQDGKDFMEKMFTKMMPAGPKHLPISNMNMGGMGAKMIRQVMEKKNVDSLETLMENAMNMGVRIVACAMSMDVMGIRKEELIDGVEIGGVATYLGQAENANVNLFI
ncbi:DsrE/DsrF/DrsH-like family protein [Pseudobacillus sp. FSL P4-0506]|uniref:DsrE/DsrF/DrsH-like family protein n=1 Tax=unclassified Pseudobacillus TaxID=2619284 RepID=UPI0030FBDC14